MTILGEVRLVEGIPEERAYRNLFDTTGWNQEYRASTKELHAAISRSWHAVSAYDSDGTLVGFGRVVSDGILYGFVCDMIVAPEHQGRGVGRRILDALVAKAQEAGFRVLWLFAAAGKSGFYEKHGFSSRPPDAPGMQRNLMQNP